MYLHKPCINLFAAKANKVYLSIYLSISLSLSPSLSPGSRAHSKVRTETPARYSPNARKMHPRTHGFLVRSLSLHEAARLTKRALKPTGRTKPQVPTTPRAHFLTLHGGGLVALKRARTALARYLPTSCRVSAVVCGPPMMLLEVAARFRVEETSSLSLSPRLPPTRSLSRLSTSRTPTFLSPCCFLSSPPLGTDARRLASLFSHPSQNCRKLCAHVRFRGSLPNAGPRARRQEEARPT